MRFIRLLRLHKAATIADVIQMRMRSEYLNLLVKMLRQSMLIIIVNHYIACAWFSVSDLIDQNDTWVYVFGVKDAGLTEQYLTSFHWSLTQFAPATNNIAPQNWIERAFASCIVIYAFVAFSSFVSAVTNAANELRAFTMRSSQQEAQIRRFLGDQKVSSDLWCRIRKFCQEANSRSRMVTEQDIAVFNEIPESLRIVMHEELYRDFFRAAHIFSGFHEENPQLVKRVCHFCFRESAVHAKLDVFVDGTEADHVFVSRSGSATYWSVLLDNNHKSLSGEGHWLCELALWARWSHRGQLVADTTVRFLILNPQSFATVAASEGGSFFGYLRTLGLLLIGYAEVVEENSQRITDLTLGDILIRAFAKRAIGFADLSNEDAPKSLRISSLSALSGQVRSNGSRNAVRKV
ncbi:CngA [Symbiodinium natans]|uniref:CngA protein n=1 Tax=Symbiodinium natans TaxID=878477 RepID=A0A812IF64_9DINO|nr:CngA [Symbiodinium natans]